MFKIGEFSRFTRVTVKMLRHYDDLGLLRPSFVEAGSGYRYYVAEQLPRLNQIIALKDLGFSLDAIAVLIDDRATPEHRESLLDERRREVERAIAADAARLRHLDALIAGHADRDGLGRYDVVLRAVAPRRMATIRRRVASLGDPVTALFERLEAHVAQHRARAAASPIMIFEDDDYRETDLEIEVGVPISRAVDETDEVRVREVEGCSTMACVIYRGSYDQMTAVLQALLAWVQVHRMRIAGPLREVYLRFGADQEEYRLPSAFLAASAAELVTEVQLPVEEGDRE